MDDKRRTTRVCDLCGEAAARVRCESDEAALCWGCDAAVHGANFLVARHVRVLMCRVCLGPTTWLAAGARLGPAASLCCSCSEREESGEGEGEGENQVVPLTLAPPVSDDEEEESGSSALHADDDLSCSSTQRSDSTRSTEAESNVAEHEATSFSSDRNQQRSRLRKRSYARTLVHASPSSNY